MFYVVPNDDVTLFVCIFHARNAIFSFGLIKHTLDKGAPVFKPVVCISLLILFMIGHVLLCFGTFTNHSNQESIFIAVMCCFTLALIDYSALALKLLRKTSFTVPYDDTDISNEIMDINVVILPGLLFVFVYIVVCIVNNGTLGESTPFFSW